MSSGCVPLKMHDCSSENSLKKTHYPSSGDLSKIKIPFLRPGCGP